MAKAKILGPFDSIYKFSTDKIQDYDNDFYVLEQEQKNGDILCGALYKDNTLIKCKYDEIGPCCDGSFFAKERGIWKLVSISGRTLREFGSFDAEPMFSKLIAHTDTGWGVLGKDGNWNIPCQYSAISVLKCSSSHIFTVWDSEWKIWLFDETGKQLTTRSYEIVGPPNTYMGIGGNEAINEMIDMEWNDSRSGAKGSVMFNCKLKREVSVCEDGITVSTRDIFLCSDTFLMYRDGLVQLCDMSGRILIPFEEGYSYIGDVPYQTDEEYLFPAKKATGNEYVFINRYGVQKIRDSFAGAGSFKNGMAIVAYYCSCGPVLNRGVIDRHGNLIVKPLFYLINTCFRSDGHFIIQGILAGNHTSRKWSYYNEKGEPYEIISEDGSIYPDSSCDIRVDGMRIYCHQKMTDPDIDNGNNHKKGLLTEEGFHSVRGNFHNRDVYVKEINSKYGLYNRYKKELVPPVYDNIDWWSETIIDGTILAYKDDKCYLIFP